MPPMKVQPIDSQTIRDSIPTKTTTTDSSKPVLKFRLRRLFDRQLPSVLRISSAEKSITGAGNEAVQVVSKEIGVPQATNKECSNYELEPSSVCLAKMVQNFIEERDEKPSTNPKCGRNRCNCFNVNGNDSSDDELDPWSDAALNGDLSEVIKSLVPCASTVERNLLADTAKMVEQQSKSSKGKDDELLKVITEGLSGLGYNASTCKSRWEKTPSYPAGEHEYIDVIMEKDERIIIDVDFRSEFEIARPTGAYKSILQSVPLIFVGRIDRLEQIVSALSDAAKQSLKKKGMPIPPWRRSDYTRAKWLSSYTRVVAPSQQPVASAVAGGVEVVAEDLEEGGSCTVVGGGDFELIFGEVCGSDIVEVKPSLSPSMTVKVVEDVTEREGDEKMTVGVTVPKPWEPPAIKKKNSCERRAKVVTGLATLLREKQ